MRLNSIRFKISILYVFILGIILIAYSMFLYLSLRHTLYDDLQDELEVKAREIAALIDTYYDYLGSNPALFDTAAKRVILPHQTKETSSSTANFELRLFNIFDQYNLKKDFITILDTDRVVLAQSETVDKELAAYFIQAGLPLEKRKKSFQTINYNDWYIRLLCFKHLFKDGKERTIQIGTRLRKILSLLERRLYDITMTTLIIMVLAGFIGQLFALRILRPIKALANTALRITHEDLSSRVKIENIDEEMIALVNAFNNMIARLENSFRYITEFSSHVAHELKTPLAIMRGESEVALIKDLSIEEYKNVIHLNLKETRHMVRVIDDLLLLTSLDYDRTVFHFERKDLIPFIIDLVEQTNILARQKNIHLQLKPFAGSLEIQMDEVHLRRLFFNILDNAIKFSPQHSSISIEIEKKNKTICIQIKDAGPGIPVSELPKIFDKFFHRERPGQTERLGHGLGLSIAKAIAIAHGGKITAESILTQGTTFFIFLPLPS